jgi:hypothetical protein
MKLAKRKSQPDVELSPGKPQATQLELPGGEPDLEALRSVTREWLVPLLVDKFLRTHTVELRASGPAADSLQTHEFGPKRNIAP